MRLVIQFTRNRIIVKLGHERALFDGSLNAVRLRSDADLPTVIDTQFAGDLDGHAGWYCKRCHAVFVDDIQLYHSQCHKHKNTEYVKVRSGGLNAPNQSSIVAVDLISPKTFR